MKVGSLDDRTSTSSFQFGNKLDGIFDELQDFIDETQNPLDFRLPMSFQPVSDAAAGSIRRKGDDSARHPTPAQHLWSSTGAVVVAAAAAEMNAEYSSIESLKRGAEKESGSRGVSVDLIVSSGGGGGGGGGGETANCERYLHTRSESNGGLTATLLRSPSSSTAASVAATSGRDTIT